MPIYEYECLACGHRLEALQKMSDDPLKDCPQCNKPELKKLISAAAFRLKGGGWYETDFKSGTKKNVVQGDSKDKSGSAKKSSDKKGKSDSSSSSSTKSAGANK
ncbi:FmdB family zinc ribbon protein [Kaarinaea lacus]